MRNYSGSKVENNRAFKVISKVFKMAEGIMLFEVKADEGGTDTGANNTNGNTAQQQIAPDPVVNYEDLIAKARRDEKNKQQSKIAKLEEQITILTTQHNDDLLAIATAEKKVEKAETALTSAGTGDSEELVTLKGTVKALKKERDELKVKVEKFEEAPIVNETEVETRVREQVEAEYKVKEHRITQIAKLGDEILVPELIMGNTVEEIDATIELAKARSEEIRKSIGATQKPSKRTPNSKAPATNEPFGEISTEELLKMDVNSQEYRDYRKRMGLA